ncbi:hypothetical protein IMCC12053_1074 [Celeribacter marinus]|uniref:Uncharacterized protein n=1 Tax=Celeribacter marinus TaxID=1397108 RepID=A0A0P0AA67_9RHOB|nr:hypothetical protein IMCC12053_1074 [Celeribacter marinus]
MTIRCVACARTLWQRTEHVQIGPIGAQDTRSRSLSECPHCG